MKGRVTENRAQRRQNMANVPCITLYDGKDAFTAYVSNRDGKIFIPPVLHKQVVKLLREFNDQSEAKKIGALDCISRWSEVHMADHSEINAGKVDPENRRAFLYENADEVYGETLVMISGGSNVRVDISELERDLNIRMSRLIIERDGLTERQKLLIDTDPFADNAPDDPDANFWDFQDIVSMGEMADSFRKRMGL